MPFRSVTLYMREDQPLLIPSKLKLQGPGKSGCSGCSAPTDFLEDWFCTHRFLETLTLNLIFPLKSPIIFIVLEYIQKCAPTVVKPLRGPCTPSLVTMELNFFQLEQVSTKIQYYLQLCIVRRFLVRYIFGLFLLKDSFQSFS